MPSINFHERFADAVKRLEKRQTIRAKGKRRPPSVGDALTLCVASGNGSRKLLDAVCSSVELITIVPHTRTVQMPRVYGHSSAWTTLEAGEVEALAKADGFASGDEFFAFFAERGRSFSGHLIKW